MSSLLSFRRWLLFLVSLFTFLSRLGMALPLDLISRFIATLNIRESNSHNSPEKEEVSSVQEKMKSLPPDVTFLFMFVHSVSLDKKSFFNYLLCRMKDITNSGWINNRKNKWILIIIYLHTRISLTFKSSTSSPDKSESLLLISATLLSFHYMYVK